MAHNAVAPVVDAASEAASEQATMHLIRFGQHTVALVGLSDTPHAMHHG
jgi:hypothetical protein